MEARVDALMLMFDAADQRGAPRDEVLRERMDLVRELMEVVRQQALQIERLQEQVADLRGLLR